MNFQNLYETYYEIVKNHFQNPNEKNLFAASELGKQLVLNNILQEDLAEIHERAINQLAKEFPETKLLEAAQKISAPLMEVLMSYSIIFRELLEEKKAKEIENAKHRAKLEKVVSQKVSELKKKNAELIRKNKELEKYNRLFIGREFRIKELKQEIERLKKSLKDCENGKQNQPIIP